MTNTTTHTKPLIPKLRFKEFEGEWEENKFGKINDILDSLHQTPKEYVDDGYPMIRVTDVNDGVLDLDKCLKVSKIDFIEFTKRHKPNKDDIIMSRVGTCGASIQLVNNEPVCLGQNTVLLVPKIDKCYLFSFMKSRFFQNQVDRMVVGSTQKTLSLKDLKKFNVNLPNLPEQQKIANFLTAVDTKLQQLTTKKELLAQYKKGVMQQLFSQQLRFKEDDGSDFADWESIKLGVLTKIIAGGTPRTTVKEYWNGEIRWMNSGELNLKKVYEVENRITELGLNKSSTSLVPKYSILIGLAGQGKTRGTVAMNMVELCTNQSVAAIFQSLCFKT